MMVLRVRGKVFDQVVVTTTDIPMTGLPKAVGLHFYPSLMERIAMHFKWVSECRELVKASNINKGQDPDRVISELSGSKGAL